MSEQHTDQRLYVDDEGDLCGESTGVLVACPTYPLNDETLVSLEQARGNARRLVAAWNACAGTPTAELEAGVLGEMAGALAEALETLETSAKGAKAEIRILAVFARLRRQS